MCGGMVGGGGVYGSGVCAEGRVGQLDGACCAGSGGMEIFGGWIIWLSGVMDVGGVNGREDW